MDITTLKKANDLDRKIKEFTEALNCFEWEVGEGQPNVSTNPRLIIDFDGPDGREQVMLPMVLGNHFIDLIKSEILKNRQILVDEFNDLKC